jgi:hypothetical protein
VARGLAGVAPRSGRFAGWLFPATAALAAAFGAASEAWRPAGPFAGALWIVACLAPLAPAAWNLLGSPRPAGLRGGAIAGLGMGAIAVLLLSGAPEAWSGGAVVAGALAAACLGLGSWVGVLRARSRGGRAPRLAIVLVGAAVTVVVGARRVGLVAVGLALALLFLAGAAAALVGRREPAGQP